MGEKTYHCQYPLPQDHKDISDLQNLKYMKQSPANQNGQSFQRKTSLQISTASEVIQRVS
jgi:hypothetical protein